MTKLVVIGGDAAGMSAAARAHRLDPDLEIVAFERGAFTSYAAAGLPYLVAGLVPNADALVVRDPATHRANGIDVRTEHDVTDIDVANRTVGVVDLTSGARSTEHFDHLVIATGASPIRPKLDGNDADGIFTIDSIPDAEAIDSVIRTRGPRKAVVVGGGYTGLEMVEVLGMRGIEVTLVEGASTPMPKFDADMGERIAEALTAQGVTLAMGTRLEACDVGRDGRVTGVETDAGVIPADLVLLCLGVRPNSGLATEAGITVGATGAIGADARRSTSVEGIWAVGDCSESLHRVSGTPVWVGLGTHANKHGRVAGTNLAGGSARFEGVIGTAITKAGDLEIGCTGLSTTDATRAGFDVTSVVVTGDTLPDYFPGSAKMTLKLIAQRTDGRLLGAQIVGGPGAGKRIDALAVAVWASMTVDEVAQLDLSYSPPYAPVWETALIAARILGA